MKPWTLPISANPLVSRDDLASSLEQLMEPLLVRFVRGNSGLDLGRSAAHYDASVAQMEGLSRLLWGLAPLAAGGAASGATAAEAIAKIREGIEAGTDPESPWFWGLGGDRDQRYVEMAAISLALLIAKPAFWDPLPEASRERLASWLGTINGVDLPPTNWEFFRVLVNVALRRLGRPYDAARLEASLVAIDALYREEGWYIDESNYDLYNPFAFHFYGLVYAKLFAEEDPERCERFRLRARLFAAQYIPWFARDGASVPFGRSLCYRFAAVSFFSACAFAGEEVLSWGALRGIVLRNLRYWLRKPILDHEGLLTIGYAYPDLVVAEQYNAPGSPYWALKTYLILALGEDHPFWTSPEEELPELPPVSHIEPPHILACRAGSGAEEHVYFLNAGQYPCWESTNAAAKYAKFAYSASFGFCVSRSSYDLSKTGCDSSLLLSEGDGYWRERRGSGERFSCPDYVSSLWEPWPDVAIRTWLLPCGPWHLRLHAIDSGRELDCAEGGFSLPDDEGLEGRSAPRIEASSPGSLLASFPWAYGGIVDLLGNRQAELHKPDPNLNLLHPRVLIPILRGKIGRGRGILACAVLAGSGGRGESRAAHWASPPSIKVDGASGRAEVRSGGRLVVIETAAAARSVS